MLLFMRSYRTIRPIVSARTWVQLNKLSMENKTWDRRSIWGLVLLRPFIRRKGFERQGMQIAGSHGSIDATVNQLVLLH